MSRGISIALLIGVGGLLVGLALLLARKWELGMAVIAPTMLLAIWAAEQHKRQRR